MKHLFRVLCIDFGSKFVDLHHKFGLIIRVKIRGWMRFIFFIILIVKFGLKLVFGRIILIIIDIDSLSDDLTKFSLIRYEVRCLANSRSWVSFTPILFIDLFPIVMFQFFLSLLQILISVLFLYKNLIILANKILCYK